MQQCEFDNDGHKGEEALTRKSVDIYLLGLFTFTVLPDHDAQEYTELATVFFEFATNQAVKTSTKQDTWYSS